MAHTNQHKVVHSTFDLIKNEIENFRFGKDSPCAESSSCAGTILTEKLVKILEDEETETRKRTLSMEKALANSVVLRKILSYMDAHSSLNFRQVSRLWREEATSILLSKRHEILNQEFLCVKFKGFVGHGDFRHATGKTLQDFVEESSQNPQMLIYTGFIFEGGKSFGAHSKSILTQFFSQHGPHVQHLNLSMEGLGAEDCREIVSQSPNLKSLVLDPEMWTVKQRMAEDQDKPPPPPFSLPKLRKITLPKIGSSEFGLEAPNNLICEILTSTPNLTCIEDPHIGHFMQIRSVGKLTLLKKSLTFCFPYRPEIGAILPHFVATGPKLTSLTLLSSDAGHRPNDRTFPSLFNVLDLGQDTLEKVRGIQILGQNYNPPLPVQLSPFPNLTELHVSTDDAAYVLPPSSTILPPGHDLFQTVPNLKSLVLEATKTEAYPFTSDANAHEALKQLRISISALFLAVEQMRQWVETLGGHYPNLTRLAIAIRHKGEENIPECLKLIPRYFRNLDQLVFQIWIDGTSSDQPTAKWDLDQALTGFSKEVCNQLGEKEGADPEYQKIEVLEQIRTSSSILDLKKLTYLRFLVEVTGKPRPLWSRVSQLYAFQPMVKRQGLDVEVDGFFTNRSPLPGKELGPV